MESNEKQVPAKDETDDNAKASVEQGEMDKTVVDKTLVKDISDTEPKNLVKQGSFKTFAVNENEQCEMSTDLDFCSISRSSDLSNNPTSAISPSEDVSIRIYAKFLYILNSSKHIWNVNCFCI